MEWGICLFIYIRHLFSFILSLFNLKALLWRLLNIHITLCIDTFLGRLLFFSVRSTLAFARQQVKKPERSHFSFIITPLPFSDTLSLLSAPLPQSHTPQHLLISGIPEKVPNETPSPVIPWTVLSRSSPEPNIKNVVSLYSLWRRVELTGNLNRDYWVQHPAWAVNPEKKKIKIKE